MPNNIGRGELTEPDTVNAGPNLGDTCTTDPTPAIDTVFGCT